MEGLVRTHLLWMHKNHWIPVLALIVSDDLHVSHESGNAHERGKTLFTLNTQRFPRVLSEPGRVLGPCHTSPPLDLALGLCHFSLLPSHAGASAIFPLPCVSGLTCATSLSSSFIFCVCPLFLTWNCL